MKNQYVVGFYCAIFLLTQINSDAQVKHDQKDSTKKSYLKAGISYLSDNVYLGRRDSVSVPYISPSLGYYHKSGLYFNSSFSYIPVSGEMRIDLITLEGGYTYSTKKLNVEISVSKEFYSSQSYNVNSEVKGRADSYLSYDLGFIEPSLQAGVNFASNPDFGIGLGLEHSFSTAEDKLEISPSFLANVATQNYYADYYKNRRYSSNRKTKKQGNTNYEITGSLSDASKFQLMDYELSLPINYTIKKFTLNFTPTYAIPLNPAEITTTVKPSNGNSYSQISVEKLENIFYCSLSLIYKFQKKAYRNANMVKAK
jgi:hypothetical protein